ncbi:hypothetical protein CcCBS67573_g03204 [Chytriomyces confervae]|uniref:Uncharacterized protein n=1 Tax=Chytriomyces confervae TaxID=246404 RepID=A0A507FKJ0_9FUNG|nr:hypothetical protein CcCBS67573_g03204 [Chytriomyces confervae]
MFCVSKCRLCADSGQKDKSLERELGQGLPVHTYAVAIINPPQLDERMLVPLLHNHLCDGIAESIGRLWYLRTLDQSHNELTGEIPPGIVMLYVSSGFIWTTTTLLVSGTKPQSFDWPHAVRNCPLARKIYAAFENAVIES